MKKGYLVLSDGTVFEGERFGATRDSIGELVFTTGMCGYIETLTDESFCGQIIMQTFPQIGNYGIIPDDFEGRVFACGYVVREYCEHPSNFRSEGTLEEFLLENDIPGLCGIDTRQLCRILRSHGVMNAAIVDEIPADLSAIANYTFKNAVATVTTEQEQYYPAENASFNVALLDYGAKRGIIDALRLRGCNVSVKSADTTAEEILGGGYDGVLLSNGPGDPTDNVFQIEQLSLLLGKIPLFGICLGHQLLALAAGAKSEKLKFGHRGANQPARELISGRTYITSQNHGYAILSESLPHNARLSFVNANDGTCEGVDYPEQRAFSVQFHPEARSGPHDTAYLFDKFIKMMGGAEQ